MWGDDPAFDPLSHGKAHGEICLDTAVFGALPTLIVVFGSSVHI